MQAVCSSRNAALLQLTLRIVRKLLWMLLVLWGITLISFWVIHLAPGSPTDMETTLNPLAGEAARQRLEALYAGQGFFERRLMRSFPTLRSPPPANL